ncbi:glycosyltransferase family 4 protein [Orenia marismortui]|uniref:Glycosyltransferase involved in cell wall biosynthesis n=1 Tax=Orenia marismortui TaxID=46469 RepID=A0A4R8HGG0_9FIRM|nr:glycosyltransferase family 1 protein [Orenia marismortui]TDX59260.1 glycosyltransferase involved in cell wall biosynthesis [Orenia marismortui]
MKIGLDIQSTLKNKTGVGWYTQNIIENLADNELEFEGYAFNFLGRNNIHKSISTLNFDVKINKILPYSLYRRIWSYLPIPYNHLVNSQADIFHFFNYILPPKIRGKVIVTVYDMVYKLFPETMTKKNYRWLEKGLQRSINRADKIITISKSAKKDIMKYLAIDEEKIEIIYPGIDHELYSSELKVGKVKELREKYNIPKNFILYLGTLEPRKNIGRIIDAYAKYQQQAKDDISLVLAGKKGWMYQEIFDKVKEHSLEDKVVFTGYVNEIDKPAIYKMSKLFIFPSLYEGFGMPVLEAMASATPVITSNISSLPEVVGDAALLVDPYDISDISSVIKRILEDKKLQLRMIEQGLKQSAKFSWQKSAEKLLTVYKEAGGYE